MKQQRPVEEALSDLDKAIARIEAAGVSVNRSGRFPTYRRRLREMAGEGHIDDWQFFAQATQEIAQLVTISEYLIDGDGCTLSELKKVLRGPAIRETNRPPGLPRNTQSALYLAAQLRAGGASVEVTDRPDLIVEAESFFIGVEVKRCSSQREFSSRLGGAFRALRVAGTTGRITHGIVAVDVTDMVNPEHLVALGPNVAADEPVASLLTGKVVTAVKNFVQRRMEPAQKDHLASAVLVFATMPAILPLPDGGFGSVNSVHYRLLMLRNQHTGREFSHVTAHVERAIDRACTPDVDGSHSFLPAGQGD